MTVLNAGEAFLAYVVMTCEQSGGRVTRDSIASVDVELLERPGIVSIEGGQVMEWPADGTVPGPWPADEAVRARLDRQFPSIAHRLRGVVLA